MIKRLIFVLALAGMILTTHLWIQKEHGFDRGCWGVARSASLVDTPCKELSNDPAGHLFGISTVSWGYAFYFALAGVTLARLVAPRCPKGFAALSEILIAGGLLVSAYLVYYQAHVAHAFCALCLCSSGLVVALAFLHVLARLLPGGPAEPAAGPASEIGFTAVAVFGAAGLLFGVVFFVDRLGLLPLDEGNNEQQIEKVVGASLPLYIDSERLYEIRACRLDRSATHLDLEAMLPPSLPFLGKPGGMPVIIFYDPNCPHCREFNPAFLDVVKKYGDRARFYILPRLLWDFSIPSVEALHLAAKEGKYYEMWNLEFTPHPTERAMTVPELAALFAKLGLSTDNFAQRLEALRPEVLAERDRAKQFGVNGTPTIYLNGLKVFELNTGQDCLGTLIERMAGPAPKAPAPKARLHATVM